MELEAFNVERVRGYLRAQSRLQEEEVIHALDCHELTVTTSDFADVSMQSCLMGAPRLAEWMNQHPAERLAAWRCVIGEQDCRGA